jgi:hypothetical protein
MPAPVSASAMAVNAVFWSVVMAMVLAVLIMAEAEAARKTEE